MANIVGKIKIIINYTNQKQIFMVNSFNLGIYLIKSILFLLLLIKKTFKIIGKCRDKYFIFLY
jgi:hypothetical protein